MSIDTLALWHQIVNSSDPQGLEALLAEDVVFYSPVVHTPQQGKKITLLYLSAAVHLFSQYNFHYVKEIISNNNAALEFEVEMDGILLNGVDIINWNESGKVTEFKVFVRPLKGVNLLHQKMAELLQQSANEK